MIHVDVGPMAQSRDRGSSEQEWTLSREFVLVNEEVIFGHNGLGRLSEDECLLGLSRPKSREVVCCSGERSRKFCWYE